MLKLCVIKLPSLVFLVWITVCIGCVAATNILWSTVSKVFWRSTNMPEAKLLSSLAFIILTQLDWEKCIGSWRIVVVKSQILRDVLTCISQENHKLHYTSAFPRFYQNLIVEILVYSLSILIVTLFLWIGIILAILSLEGKCNKVLFVPVFQEFWGTSWFWSVC